MAMVSNVVVSGTDDLPGMMEWNKHDQQQLNYQNDSGCGSSGGLYVKVMTDEQMELLRRQISAYATICDQLVEMHKAITSQQDLAGMRLGNIYCDSLMTSVCHKITASPDLSAEMLCLDTQPNKGEPMFPLDCDLRSSGSLGHLAMYESVPSMYPLALEWTSLLVKWKFQGALVLIRTGKDMTSSGDAHRANAFWTCVIGNGSLDQSSVAEYLIPNIRYVLANGLSKPTYIRFLTGLKAYSQIFSRFAFGARRNRYLLED
ncbi:hypothetical protein ACSBR1_031322 [Camellia fascicularis]